jgi:hypothetical protein
MTNYSPPKVRHSGGGSPVEPPLDQYDTNILKDKEEKNDNGFEGLRLDEDEELNAFTLSALLNSGVEEALSSLTPEQLMRLAQNVEKLKKQKAPPIRRKVDSSPRRGKSLSEDSDVHKPRSSGGQFMNLPASAPQIELRDGLEYLVFTYSTKGHIQEYCIRIDVDQINLDDIPDDFKSENCVYPRALVPREAYVGNRYEYETIVNEVAWKLTWMNPTILSGKRGLVQRAVDSYRNRTSESRSRRVLRQEKLSHGTLRRRAESYVETDHYHGPKSLTFNFNDMGETTKIKIRIDLDSVDLSQIDENFKASNCLYPQAYEEREPFPDSRWEYENSCNELAWKLAWLNAQKLAGQKTLLQRAVDVYNSRYDHDKLRNYNDQLDYGMDQEDSHDQEFPNLTSQALQQALTNDDSYSSHILHSGIDDDDDEDQPQTVSTADLLLP